MSKHQEKEQKEEEKERIREKHTIKDDEVRLVGDEVAVPSLTQLDETVDASNVDEGHREYRGNGEHLRIEYKSNE